MDVVAERKKLKLGALIGGLATLVTVGGGIVAIIQYIDQNPADINGMWTLGTQTEKTSDSRYQNLKLTYEVVFVQNGNSFTGSGEKTVEQDPGKAPIEFVGTERIHIDITGTIKGKSIHADFVEHGKDRDSDGAFDWKLQNGTGVGTFSSMAADSSGSSTLTRH
jgi:hypothetical protein